MAKGWMGLFSNRIKECDLQLGDHIYSWRTAYTYAHHGIYVGDGKVVHFMRGRNEELGTGTHLDTMMSASRPATTDSKCQKCGCDGDSHGVMQSCMKCFLCDGPLYRFEYEIDIARFMSRARGGTCTMAKSDPPHRVLHRANYLLHNGFGGYHIFHNNCEDFAIYCKTGLLVTERNIVGKSGQAVSFIGAPLAAVVSTPVRFLMSNPWGLVLVTAGIYCASRYAADIGVRSDVAKVDVEDLAITLGWQSSTEFLSACHSQISASGT
ncbi:hypothetical protein O6H91_10G052100 [Diphasiastrum complanatum]|nr:hypothetical protein O6H91_10G052100 [Diphasiastrum complanatum]